MNELKVLLEGVSSVISFVVVLASMGFGIWGLHNLLYAKNPRYYFFVLKCFSRWKDTNWKLSASYTVSKNIDFYTSLEDVILQCYGADGYKRGFNLKNKKLYEFGNIAAIVQYDLDVSQNDEVSIEIAFNNINVTYSGAQDMLKSLRIFFNTLEKKIQFLNKSYNLNIKFSSINNPFYGLLIQRLGAEHIGYFQCSFSLSALGKKQMGSTIEKDYSINVFKEYISINQNEFDDVEEIATKCLLLG